MPFALIVARFQIPPPPLLINDDPSHCLPPQTTAAAVVLRPDCRHHLGLDGPPPIPIALSSRGPVPCCELLHCRGPPFCAPGWMAPPGGTGIRRCRVALELLHCQSSIVAARAKGGGHLLNSLTAKSVLVGKSVLFGRCVCNLYVGIVQLILQKELSAPKSTIHHNAQSTSF